MDQFGTRTLPVGSLPLRLTAVALPLVTCALLSLVRDSVTAPSSVLVLVFWVVAFSATGDRLAGLLAAVSSALWFDLFLVPPYGSLTISSADDVETTVMLVAIGIAVTEMASWGYRQRAAAARRSGYLHGVLNAARGAAEGVLAATEIVDLVAQGITDVLGADRTRYVSGPVHDARIFVIDHDGVVTRDGRPRDIERSGLPYDDYLAVPVASGSQVLGHFLVTATSHVVHPTQEQLRVAVLLADQVATSLRQAGPTGPGPREESRG